MSLCSKVASPKRIDGIVKPRQPEGFEGLDVSNAVEFSKTALLEVGRKKAPDSRQRPREARNCGRIRFALRRSSCRRDRDLRTTTLSGSRGSVAVGPMVSSGRIGAFPACRSRPSSCSRGTSSSVTTSPSSRTAPWPISRRASLAEPTPRLSTSRRGRWTGSARGQRRSRRPPRAPAPPARRG